MITVKVIKKIIFLLAISIFFENFVFSETLKQGSSDTGFPIGSKKSSKHHPHHRSKKTISKTDQTSSASQEEVTDQREVSQQSDRSVFKKK